MKSKKTALIIVLLFASLFLGCAKPKEAEIPKKSSGKIKVATTIMPLYDIARNVGGDLVQVKNILPPGGSPHTYEPSFGDSATVEESEIIFKLGLNLDNWMDKLISGSGNKGRIIAVVSENVPVLNMVSSEEIRGDSAHEDHDETGPDPHIWMDPARMAIMARNVRDIYVNKMPDKKDVFEKNCKNYEDSLKKLDKEYSETLSKFKKKDFVTVHSFLNYTANRYGMNQVAAIAEFPGKEPDPHRIIEVVKILKKRNVKTVFVEPQFSPRASEAIAGEIGGKVVSIDPFGSVSDPKRNTYIKNMEENLKSLQEAFKAENK